MSEHIISFEQQEFHVLLIRILMTTPFIHNVFPNFHI